MVKVMATSPPISGSSLLEVAEAPMIVNDFGSKMNLGCYLLEILNVSPGLALFPELTNFGVAFNIPVQSYFGNHL